MHSFASIASKERAEIIQETAARRSLHPIAVEKDFWVCWVLRELFALPGIGEHLMFKGGTSLSKAYGIIKRFSEDIDLSIRPEVLDFDSTEEWTKLGKSQRENRIKKLFRNTGRFTKDTIIPALEIELQSKLPGGQWSLDLESVERDLHSIQFHYPRALAEMTQLDYAKPYVLIEISSRAEHEPTDRKQIVSYVASEFPDLVPDGTFKINVLAAERTFWEKVTLLHAESSRPDDEPMPSRLARHAYDLHQLLQSGTVDDQFPSLELLKRVCEHKAAFYPQSRVDYIAAYSGNVQIMPKELRRLELKDDYAEMKDFFFGEIPAFDEIIKTLQLIERRVNDKTRFARSI